MMLLGPMPTPIPYRDAVKAGWTSPTARPPAAAPRPRPPVVVREPDTRAERPRTTAAPPAAHRSPAFAYGIALKFNQAFRPVCWDKDGRTIPGCGVAFSNTAFDRCIMRAAAGLSPPIRLLIGHQDNQEVCCTATGCLIIERDSADLQVHIDGSKRRGRLAIALLAEFPTFRKLSIGATPNPRSCHKLDVGVYYCTEADLTEVSLVEDAACEGTWLKVF